MKMPAKSDDPAKQPARAERGAPFTDAVYATRKNLSVRVLVQSPPPEPEEAPEHGYGHGV